jgi:hypothetical protein
MQKQIELLWSQIPYGLAELKTDAPLRYSVAAADSLLRGKDIQCCISECEEILPRRRRGQKSRFCPTHGISVSVKPTYVYQDSGRNFIVGNEVRKRIHKVESWRLGFETSEDALSWNVFVGLYALGGLAEALEKLTGIRATEEPELYLWGNRIDTECSKWEKLVAARLVFEPGIAIPTEPDIMLRVPGQAIVLIEAKFGSSNPRLATKRSRFGSITEFLDRYKCIEGAADPLNRKWISAQKDDDVLEQLCRNAVFAQWLASEGEQPVVINLVRREAANDGQLFLEHLSGNGVQFHVRHWEDLYGVSAMRGHDASVLRSYLENKTLNLAPAFNL